MSIKSILAKIAKGENLTDDERSEIGRYDLQAEMDKASAAARRKAEQERDELQEKLTAAIEAQNNSEKDSQLAKLAKEVEKLTRKNAENEARIKATARMDAIRHAAKNNGIVAADGISPDIFEMLLDRCVGSVDVADENALKGVLETFKASNPAMIANAGRGGVETKGMPNGGNHSGINPFAKEHVNLTEQMRMISENPNEAKRLANEAGINF